MDFERYQRQLALPEINPAQQRRLGKAQVLVVGAGGLGSAAIPYLAGGGIGHISIIDYDTISISNLHRQVIYQDGQAGQGKAELAAAHCKSLNPDVEVAAIAEKLEAGFDVSGFDLILDGSDNFETKVLLNEMSIEQRVPLISASVNRFEGQIGVFAGYAAEQPCYHCLFPELPTDARNCNEAGILGTAVGIVGMWQAHLALCFLLGIGEAVPGTVLSFDLKEFRMRKLKLPKNENCDVCRDGQADWIEKRGEKTMAEMLSMEELRARDHIIVDVRTAEEIEADPIEGALHMELSTVPTRYQELPTDKLLAFVCAGNVRSVQAAEYLQGIGFDADICVLDKFSIAA